jgi:hypothetical protein
VRNWDGLAAARHGIGRIIGTLLALVAFLWIARGGVAVAAHRRCFLIFVRLDVHKPRGLCLDGLCIRLNSSLSVFVFFVIFVG